MSTTADVLTGIHQRARNIPADTLVFKLNDDVRNDLRDSLYMTFDQTYTGFFVIPMFQIGAITTVLAGVAGVVENGDYRYKISYEVPSGETMMGKVSEKVSVEDNTVDGQIALSLIPVGADNKDVTARNIYRQQNGQGSYFLIGTISDNTTTTFTDNITQASLASGTIGKSGVALPSDYYLQIALVSKSRRIIIGQSPEGSNRDTRYYWIDYEDSPDGTSSQTINFDPNHPYTDDLTFIYRKDIPDAVDGQDLPYPLSLQPRLLPMLRLGVALFYLVEKTGEDGHVAKLQVRYDTAKSDLFENSVSNIYLRTYQDYANRYNLR